MNKSLMAVILTACLSVTSCNSDNGDDNGRKITDYKEYVITVASRKVISGARNRHTHNVTSFGESYAVKKEDSGVWERFNALAGFEYENGFEYKIRISETSYLDYSMGDPSWTEYELLDIIAKDRKDSENVPMAFLPEGLGFQEIKPAYAIDASAKEPVEDDIKNNRSLLWSCHIVINEDLSRFAVADENYIPVTFGAIERESAQSSTFPKEYGIYPPEGQVVTCENWRFVFEPWTGGDDRSRDFNVYYTLYPTTESRADSGNRHRAWLYSSLTDYYRDKYPDAGVNAVVVRYTIP